MKDADAENARDEVGVADEHWRKPLEARRALEAKAARLKAKARYRDGYGRAAITRLRMTYNDIEFSARFQSGTPSRRRIPSMS